MTRILPRRYGTCRALSTVAISPAGISGGCGGATSTPARAGLIVGANDRVRIGCIGVGYRGVQVLNTFLTHKDAQVVALCDVYEPNLNGQFGKNS
jgi:hypothetical protein